MAPGTYPYWHLSSFYFFYFASLGALVFHWNPYLQSLGLNDAKIGELIAIMMATRIIAPNVWGWLADRYGQRMRIVRIGSFLCLVFFLGVFFSNDYLWLVLVMACFSFFWNASLPQFEATTLNHLGTESARYNRIRLWGSIGFIVSVLALGILFDFINYSWLPWIVSGLFLLIWVVALRVPEGQVAIDPVSRGSVLNILRQRSVICLLIVVGLLQASHSPYYFYFIRYLDLVQYPKAASGAFIAIGVFAEILIFFWMPRLLQRFGTRQLMLWALGLTCVRWLAMALVLESWPALVITQLLHAASFGMTHIISIALIHRYFVGRHQGKGQAFYSAVSFGLGGAVGSLYCGYLSQIYPQNSAILFYTATLIALVALAIAWYGVEKKQLLS